ncbi:ABC transporter substrate-binding protein [Cohnella cellulosilytica]|uniref:ABC transporter substrate-binding protein n=1 Tax=Cohnella cellulosilytica TaxID=986710 RepID=A0ABW2F7T0_9BACL
MIAHLKPLLALLLIAGTIAGCSTSAPEEGGSPSQPAAGTAAADTDDEKIELTFYYPVQVGGPLTATIEAMSAEFTRQNPNITVKAVYTGNYADTGVKTQAAVQGGNPPDVAVMLANELFTLMDMDAVIPLDDFIARDADESFLPDFFPAFMANAQTGGQTYSIPFQRSTVVLYYNKDAFRDAGLDPEKPPTTWDELTEMAVRLTKPGQWGIEIPQNGTTTATWLFQTFALQNGKNVMTADGKQAIFNTPENVEALQFWVDLSQKHKAMPEGILDWATTPSDFIQGKTAMMYHTSGNLANVKANAGFDFGVSFLPAKQQYGSPTGGGNLYIFKGIPEKNQQAAWKFIKFLTEPERAAQWSIDTGYVAVRESAYETEQMKAYTADFPEALVAKDQLPYADSELATHNVGRVVKALSDAIQRAVTGNATPAEALKAAQEEADKALVPFQ